MSEIDTFACKIIMCDDAKHSYWVARNKLGSLISEKTFGRVCNASANCNRFMEKHNFDWIWVKKFEGEI